MNMQAVEYSHTLAAKLRNYVKDHYDDWDDCEPGLTYAFICQVQRSDDTKPFDLDLSRRLPDLSD